MLITIIIIIEDNYARTHARTHTHTHTHARTHARTHRERASPRSYKVDDDIKTTNQLLFFV